MNETRFTGGDWRYGQDGRIRSSQGNTIADVRFKNGANDGPLLAAAPELYEALARLRQWHKEEYQSNPQIDALADAALAKAREQH